MGFFKNILKALNDQIKWGNRKPEPVKLGSLTVVKKEERVIPVEPRPVIKVKGKPNSFYKNQPSTPEQRQRRRLRKLSRASRRFNLRMGYQGAR